MLKSIAAGAPRVPKAKKKFLTRQRRGVHGEVVPGQALPAWDHRLQLFTFLPQAAGLQPRAAHQWYPRDFPTEYFIPTFTFSHQPACLQDLPPHALQRFHALCTAEHPFTHLPPSFPLSHQQALVLWPAEPSGRKESLSGSPPSGNSMSRQHWGGELHCVLWLL